MFFKKRFFLAPLFLTCLFCLWFSVPALCAESEYALGLSVYETDPPFCDEFYITGAVPQIAFFGSDTPQARELELLINEKINAAVESKIGAGISLRTKGMSFSYEIKNNETGTGPYARIISIVLYAHFNLRTYQRQEVFSVAFNTETLDVVDLNVFFGPNSLKIINAYVYGLIRAEPEIYVLNFAGVTENTAFYFSGDAFNLVFNSLEFAKGSPEAETVSIPINFINNYIYPLTEKNRIANSSAVFLPLREICEYFGFMVYWRGFGESVLIYRDGVQTEITPGLNIYAKGSAGINIMLESGPVIYGGTIYAPITFFEEILGLSYYVSENTVTISEIAKKPLSENAEQKNVPQISAMET